MMRAIDKVTCAAPPEDFCTRPVTAEELGLSFARFRDEEVALRFLYFYAKKVEDYVFSNSELERILF